MLIALSIVAYLLAVTFILRYNHVSSVMSGNHEDPYRDVGNGGCSEEQSIRQYHIDQMQRQRRAALNRLGQSF
jgi:hypothetical protein